MAMYVMRLLDPFGQELHATAIELEGVDGIDSLTGLMTTPESVTRDKARFTIKGGFDERAAYSVEFTRQ